MRFVAGILSLVVALAVVGQATAQKPDQVTDLKKKIERGTVTKTTPTEIELDIAGVGRTIPLNEIAKITFGDEPDELTNARNAIQQKNYGQALDLLKKVDEKSVDRDLVKQDLDFYKALCLVNLAISEGGNKADAEKAMLGFVAKYKTSFHFYEAAEQLGDLAVAKGDFVSAASKFYGDKGLSGAPFPDYQIRANIKAGRALQLGGKADEGLAKFEAAIAADLSTPEAKQLKMLATAGKASCLAESGKVEEAVALATKIIADSDPSDTRVFARANNALGLCHLKANRPKDALLAFLQTDLLFYQDSDAHAEALYHLAKLWDQMAKADRATAARKTLSERYSGSLWANKS